MKKKKDLWSKVVRSLSICTLGAFIFLLANHMIASDKIKNEASEPETHDVELWDNETEILISSGEYEVWIRAFSLDGSELMNANFKTNNRLLGDALFDDLASLVDYEFDPYGDKGDDYGRWVYNINGIRANLSGDGPGTFYNSVSTTHHLCKGNNSPYTGRENSCTTWTDNIYLDYQNVFEFHLSAY